MPLAAVLHAARDLRVRPLEERPLAPGFVRVRVRAGGICGSDLHYFQHGRSGSFELIEPLVLGHEVAGEVIEVPGEGSGLWPGDRVAVNPSRPCGRCPRCLEGRENLCSDIFFMGSASKRPHMQGGFAETIDVRPAQCFPLPATLPLEQAALAEPLAVCLHAAARAGDIEGRSVLVTGAGPIGLLVAAVARLRGAVRVVASDPAPSARERALAMGADAAQSPEAPLPASEGGYDLVFEASGSPAALAHALEAARRGGTVVQLGNLPGEAFPLAANQVMAKELDLRGSFRFGCEYAEAVALIAAGEVPLEPMITGRFPLQQAPEAFAAAADRSRSSKVVLTLE